jgi:TolB protein
MSETGHPNWSAAGGRPRLLRDTGGSDSFPTWSPDGSHLAFVHERGRKGSIAVEDLQTGRVRRVTPASLDAVQPAWSPRGGEIAFVVAAEEAD